jgi:F-type H+-transporting ATPase subunit epsilon
MKTFSLEINTPHRLFLKAPVEALTVQLADGEIGIYAGRYPFTAPVKISVIKIFYRKEKTDEKARWREAFISEGIIEVKKDRTVILVDSAEWPEEIDYARAETSRDDALKSLRESGFRFASAAAKKKLNRAETRLKLRDKRQEG